MTFKIAIITDIHHGPASHTKAADWQGLPVLRQFIDHAIADEADLVLDLGDHISDTTFENDLRFAQEVAAEFKRFPGPVHHLLGNHDVVNLSIADNETIFGALSSRVVDLGATRLILWQPGVQFSEETGFRPTGEALDWLTQTLMDDKRPAIIATHVPVSGQSQIGSYYFENRPHLATYPDHHDIREQVELTGRAALWLSGHVHRNTVTSIRGIQHVTIQSMSERSTTMPDAACAYADVQITGTSVSILVHGADPFQAKLPFLPSGSRTWLQAMPGA